jgi:hypothetical protein
VKTEKSQLKKENREFVQPKKIMEKSQFRMEISAFFLVKTQKSQLKKNGEICNPKKMNREISIQKQKKCFQLITFEVKNIHGAFSKKVNEDPFWKKNQSGESVLEKK